MQKQCVKASVWWYQQAWTNFNAQNENVIPVTLIDKCDPTASNLYTSTILVFICALPFVQKALLR